MLRVSGHLPLISHRQIIENSKHRHLEVLRPTHSDLGVHASAWFCFGVNEVLQRPWSKEMEMSKTSKKGLSLLVREAHSKKKLNWWPCIKSTGNTSKDATILLALPPPKWSTKVSLSPALIICRPPQGRYFYV